MMEAVRTELVASFDDDSWPLDRDFFARVQRLADGVDAAVYCGGVVHRGEPLMDDIPAGQWCADFCGGAAVFRRSCFLRAGGYVPVATAYGIEEVDLAIRLSAMGGLVFQTPWLRVFHDTDLARHADREVTAASIANIGLLTYLRYPRMLWMMGAVQLLRRVVWLVRVGRLDGILEGMGRIPAHIRRFAAYRQTVGVRDLRSYWMKRRRPRRITIPTETVRGGQEAGA
jgi:GT2 family glycosyltransferase